MSKIETIEQRVEAEVHKILSDLESKLQNLFGSHPKLAEHIAEAKAQVSEAVVSPSEFSDPTGSVEPNPPIDEHKESPEGDGSTPPAAS